jgi:hypothetical protein
MRFYRSRYLFYLAVAAPPAAMVALIHRYGVNVPVLDEWDMSVPLSSEHGKVRCNLPSSGLSKTSTGCSW